MYNFNPMNLCEMTVVASVAGLRYPLNNVRGWLLDVYDGLGLTETRRLAQRGVIQDGDTDLGWRREPRFLALGWAIQGCSGRDWWDMRQEIQTIWRPRYNEPVVLTYYLPNGDVRAADTYMEGEVDFKSADRQDGKTGRIVVVAKASDPRLYDPTLYTLEFNLLATAGGLPIPFTIPIPIGADTIDASQTLIYAFGDPLASVEYPLIYIFGPITNPIIENLTTDEKIDLSANGGLVLGTSDFVVIDLSGKPRFDAKTIRDQDGNSMAQYLSTDSDLGTWHLSYKGEKLPDDTFNPTGANVIRVRGTGANLNTRVLLRYYHRYEGA